MKKKIIGCLIIIIILIGCGIFLLKTNYDYQKTDLYKFNKEYNLSLNSVIKYANINDLDAIFKSDQAVLFIGSSKDITCQKIIPLLNETINKYQLKNFYYLNIDNDKSEYDVVDNKVVKVKDGSEGYYKLLEKLEPLLLEEVIKKDNKEYKTGEKQINLPFVVTIKNGEIINYHENTVKLNNDQKIFDDKNNEQRLKLLNIYSDLIFEIIN